MARIGPRMKSPHDQVQETDRAGIGFAAMDNVFAAVDDSAGLQAIWTVWDRRRFRLCGTSGWCCCPNPCSVTPTGTPATYINSQGGW